MTKEGHIAAANQASFACGYIVSRMTTGAEGTLFDGHGDKCLVTFDMKNNANVEEEIKLRFMI
jgi:hypothetical protein